MPRYEQITRYLDELESAPAERVEQVLYEGFCEAFYRSGILDIKYIDSIGDISAIRAGRFGHANIEALGIDESTRRLITW